MKYFIQLRHVWEDIETPCWEQYQCELAHETHKLTSLNRYRRIGNLSTSKCLDQEGSGLLIHK